MSDVLFLISMVIVVSCFWLSVIFKFMSYDYDTFEKYSDYLMVVSICVLLIVSVVAIVLEIIG